MEKQKNVYAPGDDPASIEANRAYQDALKKLTESLDQRKNRFFEPTLLAAAQGFLQPGTSNFFDSLGNVAGNIAKSQEAQVAEDQAIAQQRFELAGRGVELQRQKGKDAMWRSALEDKPALQGGLSAAAQPPSAQSSAAGSGALPSGGQGATGPLAQAAKSTSPSGSPFMPGQQGPSREKFFAAAQMDGKTLSDTMKEWEAIEKGQIQIKDKFGTNLRTGEIFMVPTGNMVPTQIFREDGTVGTYTVPENVAAQLSIYAGKDDADSYFELANKYIKGPQRKPTQAPAAAPGAPAAVGAAPTAERPATPAAPGAAKPTGLKTVQDSEREAARRKTLEEADTQMEVDARKDFNQKARDSGDTITTANMLRGFSEDPNAKNMVGILSNDKYSSIIAKLVQEGIGSGQYRIGIPALETVMRNSQMTPEEQAKYRVLLMNIAQMRLQMSKYMKGNISNLEQELMGQAVVTTDDTPQAIRMKADILTRRAQFDRMANRKFKASKMTAEDFLESDEYQEIKDKYDKDLEAISLGMQKFQSGAARPAASQATPGTRPSTAAANSSASVQAARDRVRQELQKQK
jgi:hypothetical protein